MKFVQGIFPTVKEGPADNGTVRLISPLLVICLAHCPPISATVPPLHGQAFEWQDPRWLEMSWKEEKRVKNFERESLSLHARVISFTTVTTVSS